MYILYLRSEDAILAILCTGRPITTAVVGELLSNLIFHDGVKFITANGYMIIYFGADYVCHMMVIHFAQSMFENC